MPDAEALPFSDASSDGNPDPQADSNANSDGIPYPFFDHYDDNDAEDLDYLKYLDYLKHIDYLKYIDAGNHPAGSPDVCLPDHSCPCGWIVRHYHSEYPYPPNPGNR